MAFPRRLLNPDEEVVVDLRPHWWFFAGPAALLAASLVLLVWVRASYDSDLLLLVSAGVCLGALVWFVARYLRWMTTNFVVTTDRIVYRSGVLAKRGIEIPLDRVNTIFSSQRVIERLLGSGDLVIESGGETGRQSFSDISRPARVQTEIYRQIEADQVRSRGPAAEAAADPVAQLDRLDDLRRRGVITDAEFELKKRDLLGRL